MSNITTEELEDITMAVKERSYLRPGGKEFFLFGEGLDECDMERISQALGAASKDVGSE